MENILVSACLFGVHCRYDGKCQQIDGFDEIRKELMEKYNVIPVCPEIYGGLATPRLPAEIVFLENDSAAGLNKNGRKTVINKAGEDVTQQFEKGAKEVCYLAKLYNCKYAILKKRSPSCGSGHIYDGTFSKNIINGDGITAEKLKEQGVIVLNEETCVELLNS